MIFLLLLVLGEQKVPDPKPVKYIEVECDMLEINEVWDSGGFDQLSGLPNPPRMRLKQVILWDLHVPTTIFPSEHERIEHHCRAWFTYREDARISHGGIHRHPNQLRMVLPDKDCILVVRFSILRARWTLDWDPELEDRKVFPLKYREPIPKPVDGKPAPAQGATIDST